MNVPPEEFATVSAANVIPPQCLQLLHTRRRELRHRTCPLRQGLDGAATAATLASAGMARGQVDIVVIIHMHGDHIGGTADEDRTPTYANARSITLATEHDIWSTAANKALDAKIKPLNDKFTSLDARLPTITCFSPP